MCSLYRKMDKARKPAVEACICHQQIPLSDWRVPTAAVEVQQVLVQALQQILRRDEAMRNLHALTTTKLDSICQYSDISSTIKELKTKKARNSKLKAVDTKYIIL